MTYKLTDTDDMEDVFACVHVITGNLLHEVNDHNMHMCIMTDLHRLKDIMPITYQSSLSNWKI